MQNSESPTQDWSPDEAIFLDRAAIGTPVVLEAIDGPASSPSGSDRDVSMVLGAEGIIPGVELTPERRLPFGGPVVVRVGRTRVALARSVARRLLVRERRPDATAEDGR